MDDATWKMLEIGGNWVSGLGSLLAVVVALYLAKQQRAVRLTVTAGERLIVTRASQEAPSALMVLVTNVGQAPATITLIGWELRMFRKLQGFQPFDDPSSPNRVPIELTTGKQAVFLQPYDGSVVLQSLAKWLDGPFPKLRAKQLKVVAYTSVGTAVKTRVDTSLQKSLLAEHKKMLAQKRSIT